MGMGRDDAGLGEGRQLAPGEGRARRCGSRAGRCGRKLARRSGSYGCPLLVSLVPFLVTLALETEEEVSCWSLTLRLTSSPAFTWTTVALYILSPSPGALVSPYTEPLYAVLSFSGMLLSLPPPSSGCKLRALRLTGAAVCFAGSTSVRPTGMLNAGFLVWYGLVGPWLRGQRRASQVSLYGSLRLEQEGRC